MSSSALFATYARLWVATEALSLWTQPFLFPGPQWMYLCAAVAAVALACPCRATFSAALGARIAMSVAQAPYIWDACWWGILLDFVLAGATLLCPEGAVVQQCCRIVPVQLGLFYIGAGLWKLNTDFLDASNSCATIYVASLLSLLPERLVLDGLLRPAFAAAPLATAAGEIVVGLCFVTTSRPARRLGIVLAAALHFGIAVSPYPNSVPSFGTFCTARAFLCMPEAWAASIREAASPPAAALGLLARAGAGALVAASCSLSTVPFMYIDWNIPYQTALCLLALRAVALDAGAEGTCPEAASAPVGVRRALLHAGGAAALSCTVAYVFLFQALGLMDMNAASPFSMIRQHGGSNHLFMPTSLLLEWQAEADPSSSVLGEFGGGVVRVVESTSEHMNALYPGDISHELPPRVVSLLRSGGHAAREYAPTVNAMLGHATRSQSPHWTPQERHALPQVHGAGDAAAAHAGGGPRARGALHPALRAPAGRRRRRGVAPQRRGVRGARGGGRPRRRQLPLPPARCGGVAAVRAGGGGAAASAAGHPPQAAGVVPAAQPRASRRCRAWTDPGAALRSLRPVPLLAGARRAGRRPAWPAGAPALRAAFPRHCVPWAPRVRQHQW
ncbi:unnamed protein product [Prorocentrum cordatum]|uniref:Mannosyltransferase n=1 Tax=Prorocentrum cordatum TaxID=2364126 RepID=A0ABN9WG07_9DINO|nr:unnamed protein product [Polarella glacialis]